MSNSSIITPDLAALDNQLFELVSKINILDGISPLNYHEEREAFFACRYSKEPSFTYRAHTVDTFLLKRALFNLPIETIQDEDLAKLYRDVISSYVDKIDQFHSIGSGDFLYDSLRYYGEPTNKDILNAQFILHLPGEPEDEEKLDATAIKNLLEDFAEHEQYEYQIKFDETMIANALVSGTTVKVNSNALVSKTEALALAHHELGVHLVTTLNARTQPLRILGLGCPLNTMTQEGMAILAEYLSGCLSLPRLKILAMRVLAAKSLIREGSFRSTFLLLKEQYKLKDEQAFAITGRVFRGGGFTKDYLYLQGFHQMLNAYENEPDFNYLLAGKTAIAYLPLIKRLIEKGYFIPPGKITPAFEQPIVNSEIQQFIMHAIK